MLPATFYTSTAKTPPAKKADAIISLSSLVNNTGNDASVPPGFSVQLFYPFGGEELTRVPCSTV
jgi:hypothetical protein